MYQIVLSLHNLLRWAVVILLVILIVQAILGVVNRRAFTAGDRRNGLIFTSLLDTQILLGVLLYFVLSPLTTSSFGNIGAAMRDGVLRFFVVEHFVVMILALIVGHATTILARRAATDAGKWRSWLIGFGVTAVLIFVAIPWPWYAAGRGLLPVF